MGDGGDLFVFQLYRSISNNKIIFAGVYFTENTAAKIYCS